MDAVASTAAATMAGSGSKATHATGGDATGAFTALKIVMRMGVADVVGPASRTHSTHSGSVVMVTMSPWGSQYCHRRLGHPHHCPTTLCSSARVYVPLTRRISTPDSFCSANLMEQSICADDGCGTLDEKYEK